MRRAGNVYVGGELVVVIDCARLDRAANFWSAMLGYVQDGDASDDDRYLRLLPRYGVGTEVLLQRVPEHRTAKNRMHLDLRTDNLDAEVRRALDVGARLLTDQPVEEDGWLWHVLADPDDNEFCVLQPPASRQAGWTGAGA